MNNFALVTDSGCALTKNLRERFRIEAAVLGSVEYPDGHSEKADLDWERTTPEEYFNSMSSKKFIYKTACPNIEEIADAFRSFAKEGRDVLMICISHALSGTYNFALNAMKIVNEEFPGVKIRVVDSMRYSTAEGQILVWASALREQGKPMDEVADWIEANKGHFHQVGIMDDMYFLARTGRVSKAKAFFGTMVGVEPIADFNAQGLSEVIGKGKGKKKTLLADVQYLKELIVNPEEQILFVVHSNRLKEAEFYRDEIIKAVHPKEIILTSVDQFCGANIGPGLVSAFFYGKPISDDLSEEKALITKLLG